MPQAKPITALTAAIAGTGFIGPVHAEALCRLGVRVKGMLGSTPEKSEKARAALGLEKAYASFGEILADREVDVVHVATPNALHYTMAKQSLEAGKHVACEKPLAMNSAETAGLAELAKKSGLVAGVCYNLRFFPLNLESRVRVSRGDLGPVHAVNGGYVQDWLLHETDYNWRVLAGKGGPLRAVADIGTHWMDLVCSITGLEVEQVFADLHTVHPKRLKPVGEVDTFSGKGAAPRETEEIGIDTEDYGAILLRFKGGARGAFHVSQVSAGRKNRLFWEISGRKQALAWNSDTPNELWIGRRDGPNEVLPRDPALLSDEARPFASYPGGHNEGYPDTFKQFFRALYEAAGQGRAPEAPLYPTFEDGHREVLLCEAILASARQERWMPAGQAS